VVVLPVDIDGGRLVLRYGVDKRVSGARVLNEEATDARLPVSAWWMWDAGCRIV